jgi:hypothetical protein
MVKDLAKVVFLIVGFACLALSAWVFYSRFKENQSATSHLISYTRQSLNNIASAIQIYSLIDRKRLTNVADEVVSLSGRDLYNIVSTSENAFDALKMHDATGRQKNFLDMWNREIHCKLQNHGDQQHIVLWSDGPNKKDEDGKGDDIVIGVDISM